MPSKKYLISLLYHAFYKMSRKDLGVGEKTPMPFVHIIYPLIKIGYFSILSIMEIKLDIEYSFALPKESGSVSPSISL